jgi:hypothetical protein
MGATLGFFLSADLLVALSLHCFSIYFSHYSHLLEPLRSFCCLIAVLTAGAMAVQTLVMTQEPKTRMKLVKEPKGRRSSEVERMQGDFTGNIKVSQKPPTQAELRAVSSLSVLTKDRESIPFGDLYNNASEGGNRVLIIFIRHFFCGVRSTLFLDFMPFETALLISPHLIPFHYSLSAWLPSHSNLNRNHRLRPTRFNPLLRFRNLVPVSDLCRPLQTALR